MRRRRECAHEKRHGAPVQAAGAAGGLSAPAFAGSDARSAAIRESIEIHRPSLLRERSDSSAAQIVCARRLARREMRALTRQPASTSNAPTPAFSLPETLEEREKPRRPLHLPAQAFFLPLAASISAVATSTEPSRTGSRDTERPRRL